MSWAWFFVNILLPAVLPIIGVALLYYATPPVARGKFNLMAVLKDGQLGWIAAALSSTALFEFIDAIATYNRPPAHSFPLSWFLVLVPLLTSLIGGILVGAQGAVYSVDLLNKNNVSVQEWLRHYQTFCFSLVMTAASAVAFMLVHLSMAPEPASFKFLGGP